MDTKPQTPSVDRKFVTEPQIAKLATAFGSAVRKSNPFSDEAQTIIEDEWDLVKDDVISATEAVLRAYLDRKRNTITVTVEGVKRGRTGQQVLDATKRKQYTNAASVASMPLIPDGPAKGEFVWFKPGRRLSDAEVEQERAKRGLVQDLEMQAQYNADHPEFADTHRNGDSWQDADGNWHFADFYDWVDERSVHVFQGDHDWDDDMWFGGRSK